MEYWGLNTKIMHIRPVELADHEAIWAIFQEVIQAGDSFVFEPDTPKEDFYKHWLASYMHTFVRVLVAISAMRVTWYTHSSGVSSWRSRCAPTHY